MRILQLIDTLHPGGAERMAVNYANTLQEEGHPSFLVATREEGAFKELLDKEVVYFFINKKHKLDLWALKKLSKFIKDNHIELIHAHGTSWFFGVLYKMLSGKIKLVWHDHYGRSEFLENRGLQPLQYFSRYFDGIITVNENLRLWAAEKLSCDNIIFLNNFIEIPTGIKGSNEIQEHFELVCLANFREQKNHYALLKACDRIKETYNIRLNLIGKSFNDSYSKKLEKEIKARDYIKYYGELSDPSKILVNMQIGILSSESEGLPLAILEYAANSLAVVCTIVGENSKIIGNHGVLVQPGNSEALAEAIMSYIANDNKRIEHGQCLRTRITKRYSKEAVINNYCQFIKNI